MTPTTTRSPRPDQPFTTDQENDMIPLHEELVRAQIATRLGEAQEQRTGRHLARTRRLTRKAERAAQQARLALARSL